MGYQVKKKIKKFNPKPPDFADGTWKMQQEDIDRVQEFRKCIECFLCQDVCHVLRDHHLHDNFIGPRHYVYTAALEMHPLDTENRLGDLKETDGIGNNGKREKKKKKKKTKQQEKKKKEKLNTRTK